MSVVDVAWYASLVVLAVLAIVSRRRAEERNERIRLLEHRVWCLESMMSPGVLIDGVATGKEAEEVILSSGGLRGRRVRTCARCGKSIAGLRPQAIYCGGACRAAASRKRAAE